jgi:hypothetical protein
MKMETKHPRESSVIKRAVAGLGIAVLAAGCATDGRAATPAERDHVIEGLRRGGYDEARFTFHGVEWGVEGSFFAETAVTIPDGTQCSDQRLQVLPENTHQVLRHFFGDAVSPDVLYDERTVVEDGKLVCS